MTTYITTTYCTLTTVTLIDHGMEHAVCYNHAPGPIQLHGNQHLNIGCCKVVTNGLKQIEIGLITFDLLSWFVVSLFDSDKLSRIRG